MAVLGDFAYFAADDGIHGRELWKTDGTAEGTQLVKDLKIGADNSAPQVDVSSIDFAGAGVFQSSFQDVNNDGILDLVLTFRKEDTTLKDIYAQLLFEDLNEDGVLDNKNHEAWVSLAGMTQEQTLFEGSESLNLSLSGKALRDLLDLLFAGA